MSTAENIFGPVPTGATSFKVMQGSSKPGGGREWIACFALDEAGGDAKTSVFPIEALSLENIRAAWGPGRYQLIWFGTRGQGGDSKCYTIKKSREFELDEERPAARQRAMPQPAPAAPPALDTLGGLFQAARELSRDNVAMVQSFAMLQIETIRADSARQLAQSQADADRRERQDRAYHLELERIRQRSDQRERQLTNRIAAVEAMFEGEEEPPPPALAPAPVEPPQPLGGVITPEGSVSPPHAIAAAIEHLPALAALGNRFLDDRAATRQAAAGRNGGT
jgi:hypothetical protein